MKHEVFRHHKMLRLCRYLDLQIWQAAGLIDSIWDLTRVEATNGNIGKLSDEDIALAIDYRGDEVKMIEALVASGWLDRHHEHRLIIHDWADHCEDWVHARIARSKQFFADGTAPKLSKLSDSERREAENFYKNTRYPNQAAFGSQKADPAAEFAKRQPDSQNGGQRRPKRPNGALPNVTTDSTQLEVSTLPQSFLDSSQEQESAAAHGGSGMAIAIPSAPSQESAPGRRTSDSTQSQERKKTKQTRVLKNAKKGSQDRRR